MSNEHDDDEIRESIPCSDDGWPAGYCRTPLGLCWRGVLVRDNSGMPDYDRAWDHAVAREKARRQREGQVTAADKATAMLAEVIRERDELRATLEAERSTRKATIMFELYRERDALKADLARAVQWRDAMREKLERVTLLADRQEMVYAHDIEAIIEKDGE